ncbi:MAG TPA: right-handed parallel beta-helix repeat-containing protein [Motilibacteraceae bacterium]|nr:right-handed parallel beta-helix repeat-containing protein [Motilibacteraceae bacterium]
MRSRHAVVAIAASLVTVAPLTTAIPAGAATRTGHPRVVVSPHGSDAARGTAAHPMRTVAAAVRRLGTGGGTVLLRGGVYHQRIRLAGQHHLTIRPYRHEHPVLSGAGLAPPAGKLTAMVQVSGSRDVTVRGLEVTGYRTRKLDTVPAGFYVHGHDRRVRILGNHVHDLGNLNNTLGSFDINAHGIAAYGDNPRRPIRGLVIAGNRVDNLHLGASESVVVNGNVTGWRITGNHIHDNDNIGIDAIGFEPTLTGRWRYTQRNRARDGVIAGNVVQRIRSRGNPAYWEDGSWCDCADGIYIDGGSHIRVARNRVADSDIGIEVAAENPRGTADHVTVLRNRVTGSLFTGITTGGYCNGADDCGGVETGTSHDNVFSWNRLRNNNRADDGSPELLVQFYAYRNTFTHNTLVATNSDHVLYGTVPGGTGVPGKPGNHSDHNHFRARGAGPAAMEFGWRGVSYTGAGHYVRATGQDRHSTFR